MMSKPTSQLYTSIKEEDVYQLESIFAKRVPEGWEIPGWLVMLRDHVEKRDAALKSAAKNVDLEL